MSALFCVKEKAETTSVKSDKSTNTSGIASSCVTGDSLSISSGDTINNFEGGTAEYKVISAKMSEECTLNVFPPVVMAFIRYGTFLMGL